MGLPVRLVLYGPDREAAEAAARAAFARVAELDRLMSDYRPDGALRKLEQQSGEHASVPRELFAVLQRALTVAAATDGAFDPTVGPLVALWRESRQTRALPDASRLAAARERVGWHRVEVNDDRQTVRLPRGAQLDLGGVAKGYILQEALRTLRSAGTPRALAEGGGDIVVGDAPPGRAGWRIDVADADPAFTSHASQLTGAALATSGASVQFVEIDGVRYSHVIDPRTGLGVTSPRIARVIAADAATADALATALTIAGDGGIARVREKFPGVVISLARR